MQKIPPSPRGRVDKWLSRRERSAKPKILRPLPQRGLLRYRPKEVRNGVVDRFSDALGRFGYRARVSARFGARFRSDSGRYRSPASQVEGDGGHHHLGLGLGQSDIADQVHSHPALERGKSCLYCCPAPCNEAIVALETRW